MLQTSEYLSRRLEAQETAVLYLERKKSLSVIKEHIFRNSFQSLDPLLEQHVQYRK